MNNLKVSTRLFILVGALSTLLLLVGGLGLFGMSKADDALKTVYEDRTVPAAKLGEVRALILHSRIALNIAVISPSSDVIKEQSSHIDANMAAVSKAWDAYMASFMTPEEKELAETNVAARKRYLDEGIKPALAALRANNIQAVQELVVAKIRPLAIPMEANLNALIQLQLNEAQKEFGAGVARSSTIRLAEIAAIAVGLLSVSLLGFGIVRSLGQQLGAEPRDAANLAQSVAAGDLSMRIELKVGDSTSLMAQLKTMQDSLSSVVSGVRQNAEGVATAASQIAQGNIDLSSRTEQQASALEETAASMEQLGSTVKQNADHAREANQLAQGASTVAIKGGEVVNHVVKTMKEINDSSKRIVDIISVIDGIAFQTNILALNAAVEAARAGEQGRGFAVVASEVRNLAQRSAQAAKEIKSLISASVERVAQGTTLVDQAGATMVEVVGAIKRVTDIMGEISLASAEQSSGVAQVGEAVSQMDQATQQNAALVEQSAAAAESLRQQALQLVKAVAVFKFGRAAA